MRTPPTNWTTLMAQPHETETRINIAGVSYYGYDGESGIWSCETRPILFDKLSVGNCCSSTINLVLVNPQTIPTMEKMELYVRLTNGTLTTPWVRKGVYYIDTREWDAQHEFLTITGYDAMLKTEQNYFTPPVTITGWPKTDAAVLSEICTRIGVELDTRTVLDKGYEVQVPAVSSDGSGSDTLREVLGWIGSMYGGNWCITDEGKLRLVPLVPTDTVAVGTDAIDLSTTTAYDALGIVHLVVSEKSDYVAPQSGGTGRSIEISCPWGTQAIANNILTAIGGYVYQPLTVTTATEANPLWELGDGITVNGYTSVIASMPTAFGLKYTADIEAPESEEINHEYPYQDKGTRNIERKIAQSKSEIMVKMDSIVLRVTDASGVTSEVKLTEAGKIDLTGYATFKGLLEGTTVIDGGCIKAGTKIESPVIVGGTIYAGTPENMLGYLKMVNDGLEVYNKDDLLKFRIGYTSSDFDYPYIQLGSGDGGGANSRGIVKKFADGLWIGNGIAIDDSGNFSPQAGYNGIFVKFTDGKTYVVNGSNMMNVYTGDAIARFG